MSGRRRGSCVGRRASEELAVGVVDVVVDGEDAGVRLLDGCDEFGEELLVREDPAGGVAEGELHAVEVRQGLRRHGEGCVLLGCHFSGLYGFLVNDAGGVRDDAEPGVGPLPGADGLALPYYPRFEAELLLVVDVLEDGEGVVLEESLLERPAAFRGQFPAQGVGADVEVAAGETPVVGLDPGGGRPCQGDGRFCRVLVVRAGRVVETEDFGNAGFGDQEEAGDAVAFSPLAVEPFFEPFGVEVHRVVEGLGRHYFGRGFFLEDYCLPDERDDFEESEESGLPHCPEVLRVECEQRPARDALGCWLVRKAEGFRELVEVSDLVQHFGMVRYLGEDLLLVGEVEDLAEAAVQPGCRLVQVVQDRVGYAVDDFHVSPCLHQIY